MAGYMLYSLDNDAFQKFCTAPSEKQLLKLAQETSVSLDDFDDSEGEVLGSWPVQPEELVPILRTRITQADWFAGFSDYEKSQFDMILRGFFCDDDNELNFRCESDGIYWDVVDLIRNHHQVPANTVNEKIISQFGTKPLHATLETGKTPGFDTWAPYFSMHLPEDVIQLREEVLAAEAAVRNSGDDNACQEYDDELLPTLDTVINDQRLLFIVLDT